MKEVGSRYLRYKLCLSVPLDYMQAKRQSLSRASRQQKTTNTKRRMSQREKESRDGNKGRLCSHDFSFVSPRGHVLPNTKSEAVRITRMETRSQMHAETSVHVLILTGWNPRCFCANAASVALACRSISLICLSNRTLKARCGRFSSIQR